jgi:hypothetical protein
MFFKASKPSSRELYPESGQKIGEYTVINIAGKPGGTAIVLLCENYSGKKFAVKSYGNASMKKLI